MRGLTKMFDFKKIIFYFAIYFVVFHVFDLKTLTNKKTSVKGKVRSENEKTTTVTYESVEDDNADEPGTTNQDDNEETETSNDENAETNAPAEETTEESDDDNNNNNSEGEEESDDKETESDDSNDDDKSRGKIIKEDNSTEEDNQEDEPNVTHVYGENDGGNDKGKAIARTQAPQLPTTTTRHPSKMVPTGSWTLACPNPCSQSCAPSCTPQCCEGHFSMTAPVPVSDEPPPAQGGSMVAPMPPAPQMIANSIPPQCPDVCNGNPSCQSMPMCDSSCCSLDSLKTFLNAAAGLMNPPPCPPQCIPADPACITNPACHEMCCAPPPMQNPTPAMGVQVTQTLSCPSDCMSHGSDCNRICRSECCSSSDTDNNEDTESTENAAATKNEELEQAINQGRAQCPSYCNSVECLSKCPIVCC